MDQYALSKLGNVTIKKVSSNAEDSENTDESVSPREPPQNSNIPPGMQLPKLPPSINIIVKSNNGIDRVACETSTNNADIQIENVENEPERLNHFPSPSSKCQENEFKTIETEDDALSSLNSLHESSSEICDNLNETDNNIDKKDLLPTDYQKLSDSFGDEHDDSNFCPVTADVSDLDKMDATNEQQTAVKEFDDSELPKVKDEFGGIDEYSEPVREICDELPEVPVTELIEGKLSETVICKEEELSEKESDSVSDDADDELDEKKTKSDGLTGANSRKKKKRKKKLEENSDESNVNKKQKTSTEKTDADEKETATSEIKVGNLRRNIREVMDETKLDEATLAAQMQEKERLRRVQEQLRANRDIQRQMMQARVLSLIETSGTSAINRDVEDLSDVEEQKPNTVVVKLSSGSGPPQIVNKKMLDLLKKQNSSSASEDEDVCFDKFANLPKNLNKPQMMTPSVSIAPVKHQMRFKDEDDEDEDEDLLETLDDDDKPKNKDIVMISSSSEEDDDDDCIVISEDEEESEPEEDTSNSGMHTNDLYNVPDDQGRVLINVGHPENEKDVFLAPQIARIIKPHQIGGVRFLFDNIVESLDRYRTSEGFGCILAHSMGLGKTLQVISFCDVFLRYTEGRSVLCIMPINTLQNWVAEFNMWLPVDPETSSLKEQGDVLARQFPLFVLNDNQKTLSARANVIQNWFKEGGVLLIGYELYRQLCLKKSPKSRHRSKKKMEVEEDIDDEKSKSLLDIMYNALVKPGPDLVICDEGHRIKNSHASISQALKQIRSKRRVVLTGYPLQNNLLEYWCMVDFVRPNYLGTKTEFSNMFERPIQNGQCIDSTPQDVKLMRYRAHVLHSLLEGFVQRRSHRVLQQSLPSKYEFVLLLRMTPFQKNLYNTFMNEVVRTKAVPNPLKAFAVCCKIWNHPDILYNFLKKRAGEEDIDLDLDETVPSIGTPASGPSTPMTPSTPPHQLAAKRRGRGKAKDKPGRKCARVGTPQPINKPPLIAAVPPNTANHPKPLNSEPIIANPNNQSIPPFNSYGNQYQNFNQPNEGENFAQSRPSQNFGNQYSQQEYSSSQTAGNNSEYNNANYQQNYDSGSGNNYYRNEYGQNNYWSGGNNEDGNFYNNSSGNNSAPSSGETYYQSSSSSSSSSTSSQTASQTFTNEFSGSTEPSQHYSGNRNFSYDSNQSIQYSSREFAPKQPDMNNMTAYNMNNASNMESNMMAEVNNPVFQSDVNRNDINYVQHPTSVDGRNTDLNAAHFPSQNVSRGSDSMPFNSAGREMFPNSNGADQGVPPPGFNSFTPPSTPKRRPGRPPSQNSRVISNRQKRGAPHFRPPNTSAMAGNVPQSGSAFPPLFKPGLPGGAPLKTGNSQNTNAPSHLMSGSNDMNRNYSPAPISVPGIGNEGIWNAPSANNQNTVYPEQNYNLYNSMQPPTQNFLPNETSAMMSGGARGSRNLLSDIQPNEIFNPPESGFAQSTTENNLFNLDGFSYLNDIQMPGHTSFMGLLEGVDSMDMNQSNVSSNTSGSSQGIGNQCGDGGNYGVNADNMRYQSNNKGNSANATTQATSKNITYAGATDTPLNEPSVSVPVLKTEGVTGHSQNSQITLKKADKKTENLATSTPATEKSNVSSTIPSPEFVQNRLPVMDVFTGGQNYSASRSASRESPTFNHQATSQFAYNKNTTSTTSSLSTQTNWDSFNNYSNDYNAENGAEKSQNFSNFNAANAPSQEASTNTAKTAMQFERSSQLSPQNENFENTTTSRDAAIQSSNPSASIITSNLSNKPVEDDVNRNYYSSNSGIEMESNIKTSFGMNMGASHCSPVTDKKSGLPKRCSSMGSTSGDMYKPESMIGECMKSDADDMECKMMPPEPLYSKSGKEEPGIPYEWTAEFFKDYDPGKIEASAKTLVFFCMLDEIIRLGDRLLLFSQSLFTLDLLEDFLHLINIPNTEEKWARNKSYFRLDGSTTALEREKLINEFNQNSNIHLFLVSTRAGSLGINLVGANRVVVFDASWNPCHDTQAVCRVYRYGQQKSCYVYRFVMDHCLEKKIYDRQINKQGMSDRIVDECNPDAHLTIKDVSNLCWDDIDVTESKNDLSEYVEKYDDVVMKRVIKECGSFLSKEPFQHESLLVDRADKKLSQAEKRMAKRGYELEKQASLRPSYGIYTPPLGMPNRMGKPMASVRPMLADHSPQRDSRDSVRRWIPAEVWQKQGMSAQEMTLPLDVVIPTSTTDNRSSIVLNAGQKVMVLKSHKGIYMQLENGKIIAIKTALKPGGGPVAGKSGMPGRPPNPPIPPKLLPPKAPVDRNLAALSNRRDVTVSPIRNRFPMRTTQNVPMPNIPSRPAGLNRNVPRPNQPIIRPFPLSRSQGRPPSRLPAPTLPPASPQSSGKQIFGPNSAVTISVANKKKMESQMRIPIGIGDQPMISGLSSRSNKEEFGRNYDKNSTSHLTEVNYDDYNPGQLRESPLRMMNDTRKSSNSINDYASSEGFNPRSSYAQTPPRDHRNTGLRHPTNISGSIPESLRHKKDINLTPLVKNSPTKVSIDKMSIMESTKSKLPSNMPYQQPQQHHHQQPPPQYQMPQSSKLGPPNMAKQQIVPASIASNMRVKQPMQHLNPDVSKMKKDVASAIAPGRSVDLPKSSAQHSISIFPVGKKGGEEVVNTLQPSASFQTDQSSFQQQQQQQPQSKNEYYATNYPAGKQFGGNYSASESQFPNPYDTYKQGYSPGYATPSEYSQSQQQSFSNPQYPAPPPASSYTADNFGSGSYASENSQQQYPSAVYSNQPSASQSAYEQFGTYYNYAQKNDSSQQPTRPAPSSQSAPH